MASADQLMLGRLATKVAQEVDTLTAYQQAGQTGVSKLPSQAAQQPGTSTPLTEITRAVSAMSPEAGLFVPLIAQFLQPQLAQKGINLYQTIETRYGGSARDAREAERVLQAIREPTLAQVGQSANRVIGSLDDLVTKVAPGMKGTITRVWSALGDDRTKGMVLSNLAMAEPEIRDAWLKIDPGLVLDYTPLINATYMRNKGKFNEQDFRQLHDTFMQMRDQGQLGNVPAQVALEAVPYAMKHVGPQATASQIANISNMAHEAQQRGLAPTFGTAMELIGSFGNLGQAAKNPGATLGFLDSLETNARAAGLDRAKIYELAQLAQSKGMPVRAMLEGQIGASQAAKLFRGQPDQAHVENAALETFGNLQNTDSVKALAVLKQKSPRWSAHIDQLVQSGRTAELNALATKAMRDPANWRLMQSADTARTAQTLASTPGMASAVVAGDIGRFAKNTNNKQLQRLLANPQEFQRRLVEQDYSGLDPRTVEAISNNGKFQGRLGAAFLATRANQQIGRTPVSTEGVKTAPLTRLGVQYQQPKPATVPLPTAKPKPAPIAPVVPPAGAA